MDSGLTPIFDISRYLQQGVQRVYTEFESHAPACTEKRGSCHENWLGLKFNCWYRLTWSGAGLVQEG